MKAYLTVFLFFLSFTFNGYAYENWKKGTTPGGDSCVAEIEFGKGLLTVKVWDKQGDYFSEIILFQNPNMFVTDLIKNYLSEGHSGVRFDLGNDQLYASKRGSVTLFFDGSVEPVRVYIETWKVPNGPIPLPEFLGKAMFYESLDCSFNKQNQSSNELEKAGYLP